jgi:hypothetical protein
VLACADEVTEREAQWPPVCACLWAGREPEYAMDEARCGRQPHVDLGQ